MSNNQVDLTRLNTKEQWSIARFISRGLRKNRQLGPLGAILFFAAAIGWVYLGDHLFRFLGLESVYPIVDGTGLYACVVLLPLAYLIFPQVFSKRFWHFPSNSWKWILGLAGLNGLLLFLGEPLTILDSKYYVFGAIITAPLIEEIVRAVLISPLIERWGIFWAIVVTGLLTTFAHPSPLWVLLGVFAQTIMFVATNRSIPATAFAHSIMNAIFIVPGLWLR